LIPSKSTSRFCDRTKPSISSPLYAQLLTYRCGAANRRFGPRLYENCEVEFAGRNFVSTSSIRKITMLATTVGRSLKRKQFCAFLARARFHTAWAKSRQIGVGLQLGSEVVIRLVRSRRTGLGNGVSDDLSHLNSRPCMLHQCRAHSPYQVQFSCRCCQPLRSPRPLTSGTSITGMATASCPAIISRPTTAFQFMVRRDQSAALQTMRQATGIMAGGTISAILGFSMDATTAAVSARAGLGRPSGRCGIVGRSPQKVWPTDGQHIALEPAAAPDDDPALIQL